MSSICKQMSETRVAHTLLSVSIDYASMVMKTFYGKPLRPFVTDRASQVTPQRLRKPSATKASHTIMLSTNMGMVPKRPASQAAWFPTAADYRCLIEAPSFCCSKASCEGLAQGAIGSL